MTVTPEQEDRLAAWLDGALPEGEAQAFAMELAANPALRALEQEWRANDRLIADAFAPVAEAPIDPALLRKMGLEPEPAVASSLAANDNQPARWRRFAPWGGAAMAAGIALAVMLGRPAPVDPLSQALDRTPSLASATLPDGRRIEPTLTVRAADGRWCREYRSAGSIALACRNGAGRWTTEGEGAAPAGQPQSSDGIAMASGPEGAALDGAYRRLGASDPVDAGAEARLIGGGWK
ncbi:anti-sigma factor family protein [Novosphingobium cyanobacteriorum]|uniref:Anti-sigma factor n=1 Tax=Novosphingobium cyanobacteriorum TaxID=3024215 RepID=A0ABT6CCV6_9SPHN|nr:hypothetical protein [Novosphingobium cyanobacteriorum]MDF8331761.1 hypothetical protein [Novosphingobium cyanobacteriorum]